MAIDFPSSPAANARYIAANGWMYFYADSGWTTYASTISPSPFTSNQFRYRSIYTRGYTSAGYIASTPWRTVNRTQHSTDITTNIGDLLEFAASYIDGSYSDYYHYVYGASNAHATPTTNTTAINMSTEASRAHSSTWDTKTSRGDCAALMNPTLTIAYITGGGSSATDKHNFVTETMYAAGSAPANPVSAGGTGGGISAFYGEFRGWINVSASVAYLTWSNETWTTGGGFALSTDGQPKGLSSKHGLGYCSAGSYGGTTTLTKFNDVTGATISGLSRPEAAGEENWQTGQDWGYSIGCYNGIIQNNNSTKVSYLTDTCVAMGADTQPKGHAGMSSGCCASASAYRLGGL